MIGCQSIAVGTDALVATERVATSMLTTHFSRTLVNVLRTHVYTAQLVQQTQRKAAYTHSERCQHTVLNSADGDNGATFNSQVRPTGKQVRRDCARNLRSSSAPLLAQPSRRTDFAARGFRYSAPAVWNSLHRTVLDSSSLRARWPSYRPGCYLVCLRCKTSS